MIHDATSKLVQPLSDAACNHMHGRLHLPTEAPMLPPIARKSYENRTTVRKLATNVHETRPKVQHVMACTITPELQRRAARLGLSHALHMIRQQNIPILYTSDAVLIITYHNDRLDLSNLKHQSAAPLNNERHHSLLKPGSLSTYIAQELNWLIY